MDNKVLFCRVRVTTALKYTVHNRQLLSRFISRCRSTYPSLVMSWKVCASLVLMLLLFLLLLQVTCIIFTYSIGLQILMI